MSSCERFELLASLAIDEEATLEELAELTAHLETCPACRAYAEDLRRIHASFLRETVTVPVGFSARLMDRVRETKQDPPEKENKVIPFPHWRRWAALAACCAVVALSAWGIRNAGGVRGGTAAADDPPQAQVSVDLRSAADSTAEENDPQPLVEEDGTAVEDTESETLREAQQPTAEEYKADVNPTVKEENSQVQSVSQPEPSQEPAAATAAIPPESSGETVEPDEGYVRDNMESGASEKENVPASTDQEEPVTPDDAAQDAETPASAPVEEPEEPQEPEEPAPEPMAEPVEVIGVPEPGVLTAYGSAAQAWVETVLGLEWAGGGSYSLTAEQYGDLLRTLDEAGEPYQTEPGEGYCLMTE